MMHSTNNDAKDNINDDSNPQKRPTNTSPTITNPSPPLCTTLLVIDDTSDSEDATIITSQTNEQNKQSKNIPNRTILTTHLTTQSSNMQNPTNLNPPTQDVEHDTNGQNRRRNSSIAKILNGRPLHNQQYEEIHQQIRESQLVQNANNNIDGRTDHDMQRTRSSITRTLLLNTEQSNGGKRGPSTTTIPSGPSFSKDFEYLIRHELDKVESEHRPITVQRNHSISMPIRTYQTPSDSNAQIKLKRKRVNNKPAHSPSNIPPFSLHNPSDSEPTPMDEDLQSDSHLHLDLTKRTRIIPQQQYPSSYLYHNNNVNSSPIYNHQFHFHQDPIPSNNHSPPYEQPLSPPSARHGTSVRKSKSMLVRGDVHDRSKYRGYSNNISDPSSEPSSKATVPLKKRLLDAYNNEHHPTTFL